MQPRVSLLLPCRDVERFLPECIESLQAQTEPHFEVLTLDDGSVDRTAELLHRWAESDPRVRLFEREGDGLIAALRRLSREARAPLIGRMDADDIARPERIARQLAFMESRSDIAACGTGVRYFPRPPGGSGYLRYESWLNTLIEPDAVERDLFVECPIAHPTLMVRRDAFEAVGGYRDTAGPEDYDLVLRLGAVGYGMSNVPEILHEWRLGAHRLSERSGRYDPAAFRRLKIDVLVDGVLPGGRSLIIWGAGRVGKAFVRAWNELGQEPIAAFIDLDPRKIGQRIHGAPVLRPADLTALDAPSPRRAPASRPYVLIAVGSPGAREDIREALDAMEFRELDDYRAVA